MRETPRLPSSRRCPFSLFPLRLSGGRRIVFFYESCASASCADQEPLLVRYSAPWCVISISFSIALSHSCDICRMAHAISAWLLKVETRRKRRLRRKHAESYAIEKACIRDNNIHALSFLLDARPLPTCTTSNFCNGYQCLRVVTTLMQYCERTSTHLARIQCLADQVRIEKSMPVSGRHRPGKMRRS